MRTWSDHKIERLKYRLFWDIGLHAACSWRSAVPSLDHAGPEGVDSGSSAVFWDNRPFERRIESPLLH